MCVYNTIFCIPVIPLAVPCDHLFRLNDATPALWAPQHHPGHDDAPLQLVLFVNVELA